MNVDVVMLTLTKSRPLYNMTKVAIDTLIGSEPDILFNIWLIESNPNYIEEGFAYDYPNVNVIVPTEPFNYNTFSTIGINQGSADWVVVCNNDLIFADNWFAEIMKTHEQLSDVSSFSPWNPYENWHESLIPEPYQPHYEGYSIGVEIAGWCLVAKRKVFETITLDDRVSFWYSDNIYSDEIQKHGIRHALVHDSKVYHLVGATTVTMPNVVQYELTDGQRSKYMEVG